MLIEHYCKLGAVSCPSKLFWLLPSPNAWRIGFNNFQKNFPEYLAGTTSSVVSICMLVVWNNLMFCFFLTIAEISYEMYEFINLPKSHLDG